ncbi:hypothetical protein FRB96_001737 [Tulasnella sp. 330]|nr:hypothetical protein FRB96_001737 [Tulasnella sp. 330]KAG8875962.1 hypothetical protein FRB98_007519 [Tulasnella sp. 332]KAG8881527.1 hypothetical protein FRB97_009454 [Tulasnella sp. 331]
MHPKTLLHGHASTSFQVEGGYQQDGPGPSNWDEGLKDMINGNEPDNSYNMWKDDIELLKKYGATSYRFSISWSRFIPLGGENDLVNQKGLDYYSSLIDGLLAVSVTPFITLTYFNTPLELEKRYSGWLATGETTGSFFMGSRIIGNCFSRRTEIE